jgi:hypothetical protein
MSKLLLLILGSILGSIAVASWNRYHTAEASERAQPQRWQYRVAGDFGSLKLEELQKLGEEGWELVCVDRQAQMAAAFYFRKPK